MLYEFVDTVTVEDEKERVLPSEAMMFNGDYLEDLVDGYRTLYVNGRESMLAEINAYETGVRDGTGITSKRFPARELVVGYLLRADSCEAFREAYNALNGILNTQDAQIIFHDEEDKYFVGTPEGLEEIEPGRNFVQGEIIIYCADPFKYSLEEKEPEYENGMFTIDYEGTYKAAPVLEADFTGDCGYVSWAISSSLPNNAKVIQLGDSAEEDLGEFNKSETLISQTFNTSNDWSSWSQNTQDIYVNIDSSLWNGVGGTFRCSEYLMPDTFSKKKSGYWCGLSISRTIPADSNGVTGATEWKVSWKQMLSIGTGADASTCRGGIQVIVSDSSNRVIGAANMYKGSDDSGTTGRLTVHTYSSKTSRTSIDFSNSNKYWGSGGSCTMTKSGSKISWNLGGLGYSLTDSSIENMTATRVTVLLLQRSEWPHLSEGIYNISFQKSDVSDWRDVANTFGRRDTAIADCTSGTVLINGSEDASYGMIGNNWETFCLYPGTQQIGFSYSDWCEDAPTTTIKYREVFV